MEEIVDLVSQGERTFRRLRSDIVFGRLAPSQRLPLDRLRGQYETSVGTLREVLVFSYRSVQIKAAPQKATGSRGAVRECQINTASGQ